MKAKATKGFMVRNVTLLRRFLDTTILDHDLE